jgi:hypothetical protein
VDGAGQDHPTFEKALSADTATSSECTVVAGFKTLHDQIPEIVGDCLEDEHFDPISQNAEQRTTRGLLVWRKADNWTAFTDGKDTWINGPYGLQSRPNQDRFEWEALDEHQGPIAGESGDAERLTPIPGRNYPRWIDPSTIPPYRELKPENTQANQTPGRPMDPAKFRGPPAWRPYYERIRGDFTGTTERILEWAARKWGFDELGYPDLAKAMAHQETNWRQSASGDYEEGNSEFPGPAFQSYGITQVKRTAWPGSYPNSAESTAFSADYTMAVIRSHYDGAQHLGAGTKGNLRNAVAAWFSGKPYDGDSAYAKKVFGYNQSKPWKKGSI